MQIDIWLPISHGSPTINNWSLASLRKYIYFFFSPMLVMTPCRNTTQFSSTCAIDSRVDPVCSVTEKIRRPPLTLAPWHECGYNSCRVRKYRRHEKMLRNQRSESDSELLLLHVVPSSLPLRKRFWSSVWSSCNALPRLFAAATFAFALLASAFRRFCNAW